MSQQPCPEPIVRWLFDLVSHHPNLRVGQGALITIQRLMLPPAPSHSSTQRAESEESAESAPSARSARSSRSSRSSRSGGGAANNVARAALPYYVDRDGSGGDGGGDGGDEGESGGLAEPLLAWQPTTTDVWTMLGMSRHCASWNDLLGGFIRRGKPPSSSSQHGHT